MSKFDNIHELFLGSGACLYNSNKGGIGIDLDPNVIALHQSLSDDNLLKKIEDSYQYYFENGRNKESYFNLREDFNKSFVAKGTCSENVHLLHLLIQLSFNSLLRFSKNGFNVPFGMKEVDFDRIRNHQQLYRLKKFEFYCGSYDSINLSSIDKDNDLIYLDPPYIASKFQYGGWEKNDEIKLLEFIDNLNDRGFKFILSNTFKHRKVINQNLIDWSSKYTVKQIDMTYNAWSAAVKSVENEKETVEVLISNFKF